MFLLFLDSGRPAWIHRHLLLDQQTAQRVDPELSGGTERAWGDITGSDCHRAGTRSWHGNSLQASGGYAEPDGMKLCQ